MARRALTAAGELTEYAWQAQVVGLARLYGWRHIFHAPDGGHAPVRGRRVAGGQLPEGKGFPDLVLVKAPTIIFVELKTRTGRVGAAQREWLDELRAAGQCAYLWRPGDLANVERVLCPTKTPT